MYAFKETVVWFGLFIHSSSQPRM